MKKLLLMSRRGQARIFGLFSFAFVFFTSFQASSQQISEFESNPAGTDPANVSVELTGTPSAAFDLWLLSIENDGANGLVDRFSNVTGTFDANGIAEVSIPDLENPSFTLILTDNFTGTTSTDIDTDDNGTAETLSDLGTILDAIGISDNSSDDGTLYASDLGFDDVLYNGIAEPELVFRSGGTGDVYVVPVMGTDQVFDATGTEISSERFDFDPTLDFTYGSANPTVLDGTNIRRTFEFRLSVDGNSSEEKLADGAIDLSSSDLELGSENAAGSDDQRVGVRFTDLLMPPGATIDEAFITFTVDATNKNADPCVQTIYVEDVANSSEFSETAFDLTGRTDFGTTVEWTVPESTWTVVGEAGDDQTTPDLAALVQQVVDNGSYAIGNAISFFFEGSGRREAESEGATGPLLTVTAIAPEGDFLEVGRDITSIVFEAANNAALSVDVTGEIDGNSITAYVPPGTDITALVPTITVSDGATIEPNSGVAIDLSGGASYSVTAEAGFEQSYTVVPRFAIIGTSFKVDPFANGFTQDSDVGDNAVWTWDDSDLRVEMNPFSTDDCLGDDWFFTPAIDMDVYDNEELIINVAQRFGGTDLQVLYATDYTPGSDASTGTWTALATISGENDVDGDGGEYTFSYDVSGVTGTAVIAFRYEDPTDGSCSEWRINEVVMVDKEDFTLQLLHYADVDGNEETALEAVEYFSGLVDAFQNDGTYGDNTLTVTSGDIIIPGPRYFAAEDSRVSDVTGSNDPGSTDVFWANLFGVQAATVGNHELDFGPGEFHDGVFQFDNQNSIDYEGSDFPWLSVNIDYSAEGDFAGNTAETQQGDNVLNLRNQVAQSAVIYVNGEPIGLVGAVTPTLADITSTGDLIINPDLDKNSTIEEIIDGLVPVLQPVIDDLIASGVNKVVMLSHMQQIAIEKGLAEDLDGVDIIVAGGSNTRMGDVDDALYPGDDEFDETYPFEATNAGEILYL